MATEQYHRLTCKVYEDASSKRKYWVTKALPRSAGCLALKIADDGAIVKWQDDMETIQLDTIVYKNIPNTFFDYKAKQILDGKPYPIAQVGQLKTNAVFPAFVAYDLNGKQWTNKAFIGHKTFFLCLDFNQQGVKISALNTALIASLKQKGYQILAITRSAEHIPLNATTLPKDLPIIANANEWVQSYLRTMNSAFEVVINEKGIVTYYSRSEEQKRKLKALERTYANKPKPTPQEGDKIMERFIIESINGK